VHTLMVHTLGPSLSPLVSLHPQHRCVMVSWLWTNYYAWHSLTQDWQNETYWHYFVPHPCSGAWWCVTADPEMPHRLPVVWCWKCQNCVCFSYPETNCDLLINALFSETASCSSWFYHSSVQPPSLKCLF
jgi:hypothetical protein